MKTIWKADLEHSMLMFKVKHLMITTISGTLADFDLVVETEGDDFYKDLKVSLTAKADSLNTNHPDRDKHLKSADFFDAKQYPLISFTFRGTGLKEAGSSWPPKSGSLSDNVLMLAGDLTIRGITRSIALNAHYEGQTVDDNGRLKAGFTITGSLLRSEFGFTFNGITEAGKIILSDEIRISCDLQLIRQQ
jgi:polyisoprenoid-binding protein YceI